MSRLCERELAEAASEAWQEAIQSITTNYMDCHGPSTGAHPIGVPNVLAKTRMNTGCEGLLERALTCLIFLGNLA